MTIASIVLTITSIILVSLGIIKPRWYAAIIYVVGLSILYSTTLLGMSVVGSDISRELLMSSLALQNGWDLTLFDPSNTSFVVGFLVPSLSLGLNIEPVWIYKVVIPMIFALTPMILYLVFRKQFAELKAFYASIFFIIMPVFSLEIVSIAKSMVAETLMVLTFWVMFTEWKAWKKCLSMLVLAIFTMWSHYTVGVMLVAYLVAILVVMCIVRIWKHWKLWELRSIPLWIITIILMFSTIPFCLYYSYASKGLVMSAIIATAGGHIFKVHIPEELKQLETSGALKTYNTDPLLKVGVGKDFIEASIWGKVFRLIQYLTQILIAIGGIWLLLRHRLYKFRAEFIAGVGGSFVLILCCMFVPSFASIINMTRFYHMSLFFLAPMFVLGCDAICRRKLIG